MTYVIYFFCFFEVTQIRKSKRSYADAYSIYINAEFEKKKFISFTKIITSSTTCYGYLRICIYVYHCTQWTILYTDLKMYYIPYSYIYICILILIICQSSCSCWQQKIKLWFPYIGWESWILMLKLKRGNDLYRNKILTEVLELQIIKLWMFFSKVLWSCTNSFIPFWTAVAKINFKNEIDFRIILHTRSVNQLTFWQKKNTKFNKISE